MGEKKKELTSRFWITTIIVCCVLLVLVTIGLVSFYNKKPDVIEQEEDGGYVNLNYTSETNALTILKVTPMSDELGMSNMTDGQYFDFTVDLKMFDAFLLEYEISVIKDKKISTIDDSDIRIYLEKEIDGTYTKVFGPDKYTPSKNFSAVGSELGSMVLINNSCTKSMKENYRLRLWLSDQSKQSEGSYSVEVDIHAVADEK